MKQAQAIIGLFVLVAGIYLAWRVLPYYYSNMEYQDYVEQQARIESYSTHSEDDIADIFAKKAQDLDIPLTAKDIHVQKQGSDLSIWAEYTVHIDVPIHPFDMHFRVDTKNRRI